MSHARELSTGDMSMRKALTAPVAALPRRGVPAQSSSAARALSTANVNDPGRFEMRSFSRTTVLSAPSASGTLNNLRAETGRIASEFQTMRATCDELKRVSDEQKSQIVTLQRERDQLGAQCGALRAALDGGKRERQALMLKQTELESTIEDIKRNQLRTDALLEESKGNYGVASKLVEDRLKDDASFVEKLKTMTDDWTARTAESEALKSENRRLSADLGDLQSIHDDLLAQHVALKESNKDTQAKLEEEIETLQSERDSKMDELRKKDSMIIELEKEHASVTSLWNKMLEEKNVAHLTALESKDDELQREVEMRVAAQKMMSQWEDKNAELSRNVTNLRRDLEKKAKEHDSVKKDFLELKANSSRSAAAAADQNIELDKVKTSLSKAESTIDELNEHVEDLELQHAKLESLHKEEKNALQATISNAQNIADSRDEDITALKVQISDLKRSAASERVALESEHLKKEQALEKASRKQIQSEIEAQVERITARNKEYINKKDQEHAKQIEQHGEEIERLRKTVEELREQLQQERAKVHVPEITAATLEQHPTTTEKSMRKPRGSSAKQIRQEVHTPNISSPKVGSKRRVRARAVPNIVTYDDTEDLEDEGDDDVEFAIPSPTLVVREPSKKRTKTMKTQGGQKLSKRMLKEKIRAKRAEEGSDPYEFDGDDLFA